MTQIYTRTKQAFTLVELIVVITILIILGTIAFISLEGYSKNSRDSVRIADVNSARKSLELYITEKGTYPIPDNPTNIIYSGGIAWIQGTIGDGVIRNLDKINKKPLDPLTGNEYTYSITASKIEYQIGAIRESGQMGYKLPINQTYAATEKRATAMIKGTYNERFLKVKSGSLNWILAIPSIITTDTTQTDVQTILDNNKLVYNNYSNLPHSYADKGYTMTGGFNYTNTNPQIYSGSLKSLTESNTGKLDFITNLKTAYNGTILQGETNYQDIVNINTTTNSTGAIYLVNNMINTNVGGIKVSNIILPTSGITTETPSLVGWRALDPNCQIDDIVVGTQTWAGCNSTLGTGVERGKKDDGTNGTIGSCYNYDLTNNTANCVIGATNMASSTSAITFFNAMQPDGININGDIEVNNIWGKLYVWANAPSACPTGWHLPSDTEWTTLENGLAGSICRTVDGGWQCHGLGWQSNGLYNPDRKLAEKLNIPLAGYHLTDGTTFHGRGGNTNLWSSTPFSTNAYFEDLNGASSAVYRSNDSQLYGFSVRCLKD